MRLAIMQPYLFPYIGYFQLIKAVDKFVFYDDVNFIKGGWINRNRILINGSEHYITVPCVSASQNKRIMDVEVDTKNKEYSNLLKTIEMAYRKAPCFGHVFPILENILSPVEHISISKLAEKSITEISKYLLLETEFLNSSISFQESKGLEKADRLIAICKKTGANIYINTGGGIELYSSHIFEQHKVHLSFIKSNSIHYTQFRNEFIPWLSIIDVLMFNSPEEAKYLLDQSEILLVKSEGIQNWN